MARAIYKRTMHRTHARSKDSDSGSTTPPPSIPENEDTAGSSNRKQNSAQPLIGHTMYVDRQVARHAKSRSRRKQIRNLKIAIGILIVGMIVLATGWTFTRVKFQEEQQRSAAINTKLHKSQRLLGETKARLKDHEQKLTELVEGRLPGLSTIEYNKLVDINDQYLLNLTFSESGVAESKSLEYHAMLVNTSTRMVLPKVKIFFFDDLGLQVGAVEVKKDHATSDILLAEMEPGETRSYHSPITIERDAVPKYYTVFVE